MEQPARLPEMDASARHKAICHLYYVFFGMVGGGIVIGAGLVKVFEDDFGLSHGGVSRLLGLGYVVYWLASIAGGRAYDRSGARLVLVWTAIICMLGALGIWLSKSLLMFITMVMLFLGGNGLGVIVNALAARLYEAERTRGINLLHAFQGLGRLVAPLLAALMIQTASWRACFLVSGICFAVMTCVFHAGLSDLPKQAPKQRAGHASSAELVRTLLDPRAMLGFLGFVFLSGLESCAVVWLPNYFESEAGFTKQTALFSLTVQTAGYVAIRLALGLRRDLAGRGFVTATFGLCIASFFAVLHARSLAALYVSNFLLGLAMGGYWPSQAALVYDLVPGEHGVLTGLISTGSIVGGVILVNISGWLGDTITLKRSLLVIPFSTVAYAACYWGLWAVAGRRRAPAAAP